MSAADFPASVPGTDPFADHESHQIDADLGLGPAYYDVEPDISLAELRELWADMEAEAGQ